ncbi:MAG: hypothetical protein KAG53_11895, partial [Endozoicomonadaceae bacterium]|nr:hypothetical protein [Endozoicomonadaceae bacterium]
MKIVGDHVHCGFRAAYSYRIENLHEHEAYRYHFLGRFVVAVKALFTKTVVSLNEMREAGKRHEDCHFSILLRKIDPVKTNGVLVQADPVQA